MLKSSLLAGAALMALLPFTPPAQAFVATQGSSFTVSPTQNVTSPTGSTDLVANLGFSNFDFSGVNSVSFTVSVENATQQGTLSAAEWQSIRLVSFGFNTDPDATGISDNSAVFTAELDANQPLPEFGKVDVCAWAGSNCAGGSNGGLTPGQSDTFTLLLTGFATDITSIDLGIGPTETFGTQFQTAFGSFHPGGDPPPPCPPGTPGCVVNPPIDVPEPNSLMMMGSMGGASLAAWGFLGWRKRRNHN